MSTSRSVLVRTFNKNINLYPDNIFSHCDKQDKDSPNFVHVFFRQYSYFSNAFIYTRISQCYIKSTVYLFKFSDFFVIL